MALDVLLDVNGDIPPYPSLVEDGIPLTVQRVRRRLRTFLGEWFLDVTQGLDYYSWHDQKIGGNDILQLQIVSAITQEINDVPGVVAVRSLEPTYNAATQTLTLTGEVVLEGEEDPLTAVIETATTQTNAYGPSVMFFQSGGVAI